MTFKKDFNAIVLHLLRGLVKDVMYFEEIVSGSGTNPSHIDIKLEELQSKVILNSYCLYYHFVEFADFVKDPFSSYCRLLIMVLVI